MKFFRNTLNILLSVVLVVGSTLPLAVHAITPYERQIINLELPIFYGGSVATTGGNCGPTDAATSFLPARAPVVYDDAAFADAIDEFIEIRNSSFENDTPFLGMGKYFVEGGLRAGINPVFVLAVATVESQLASFPTGIHTEPDGNNAFGRKASVNQPHFIRRGERWYKWDSWEASLYSPNFPSDRGHVGDEDDIFQYIARQFEDELDDTVALLARYAPAFENDTEAYLENLRGLSEQITDLAGGSIDMGSISSEGGTCVSGEGLIATTLQYAWPDNLRRNEQKPEYNDAVRAKQSSDQWWVGGCNGNDCGAFVTILMRDSGFDPDYNSGEGNTTTQKQYLDDSTNWDFLGRGGTVSTGELEPGDVAIWTSATTGTPYGHTFVYVGDIDNFETHVASASVSSVCSNSRAPEAGGESLTNSTIYWYRKVN